MKQTFSVKESHELQQHHRPLLHSLYAPHPTPNLLNLAPDCFLYTGWFGDDLVAAIAVDCRELHTDHLIRLTDAAYKNPFMLQGLIDRVLYELHPTIRQQTTVSLNLRSDRNLIPDTFKGIGFVPKLEEFAYELPILPFQKAAYAQWKLSLECPETYDAWLKRRNEHAHLLPRALPLTRQFIDTLHKRQGLVYSLKRNGVVQCTMYGRVQSSRFYIHELDVTGEPATIQEAVSFLQQYCYVNFKLRNDVIINTTSDQPVLRDVLSKQEATLLPGATYTLVKDMMPQPTFV